MKGLLRTLKWAGIVFAILLVLYSLALTLVFFIPNSWVEGHVAESMQTLEAEGDYPSLIDVLPYTNMPEPSMLDNFTDKVMLNKALASQTNSAFSGYARYWHGYLVFLRPLLVVMNYSGIRYLNALLLALLFAAALVVLAKKLNAGCAMAFALAMALCHFYLFPLSMQFSSSFILMLLASMVACYLPRPGGLVFCFFFALGSLTNFFDFLTAPLVTLGMPLCVWLLRVNLEAPAAFAVNAKSTVAGTLAWGAGYVATWMARWTLCGLFTGQNIWGSAFEAAGHWTVNGETFLEAHSQELNRMTALSLNIADMFPPLAVVLLVLCLVPLAALVARNGKKWAAVKGFTPILFPALYPYLWYLVFAGHSIIHHWFTYRAQAISLFAVFSFLLFCLDTAKLTRKLKMG